MAGVDGDHDVALAARHRRQLAGRGLDRGHGSLGRAGRGGQLGRSGLLGGSFLVEQVHHQPVAILLVGRQGETLGRHGGGNVDHHPQIGGCALSGAHAGDRRIAERQLLQLGRQLGAVDIDDDTIGRRQREHGVLDRTGQVEDQACIVRRAPEPHPANLRGSQDISGERRKQNPNPGKQCARAHTPPHLCFHAPKARAAHHASPRSVCGDKRSERPPACGVMLMSRSAFGKMPAPCWGHSIRHRASPSK
ncbi:hypothetical protein D3C85_507340 [compost metagenome]